MRSNPYQLASLRNGAFHYFFGRSAAGAAGLLTVLLLVRYTDLYNYAAYTAVSGLVALCGVLTDLGMDRVVARYVPEARMYRSVGNLRHFIWFTASVRLTAAVTVAFLLGILWPTVGRFIAVAEFGAFPIAIALFIVSETMFQYFSSVLQSLVLQKTLTRLMIIQWGGRLTLLLVAVLIERNITWQTVLWIFTVPELLGIIGFLIVIRNELLELDSEHHEVASGKWPQWDKVAATGLHNFGFVLLAAPPQGNFMKVLTAAYLPIEVVAAYGFFLSLAEKARQYIPLHFFYGMLEPIMVAAYLKDRNFQAFSCRCQLLYKSNLLLIVPTIAWVAVAGDPLVTVLTGDKFQGLSWILLVVMLQITIGSHVVLLQLILNSLQKTNLLLKASIVALPIFFLALIFSIISNPTWLISGPLIFSFIINIHIIHHLKRSKYPYMPDWHLNGKVILSGVLAFVVTKIMNKSISFPFDTIYTLILSLIAISVAYYISLFMTKAISESEYKLMKSIILGR
jgi:pyruvyl transferase EpsO